MVYDFMICLYIIVRLYSIYPANLFFNECTRNARQCMSFVDTQKNGGKKKRNTLSPVGCQL